MKKALWFGVWTLCGAAFFASFEPLEKYYHRYYSQREPHYCSPTEARDGQLHLRSDDFGKGHYGASRNGGRSHQGIDILSSVGGPVHAAKSGRISVSGVGRGYGNYVEIVHPDGLLTRYAHLGTLSAPEGDWVEAGHRIGTTGKTGNADDPRIRPHLHFEIRSGSKPLNPSSGLLDPNIRVI